MAVLASGSGTNLQAIIDYNATLGSLASGEVVLVGSNRESAGALERARTAGLPGEVFDSLRVLRPNISHSDGPSSPVRAGRERRSGRLFQRRNAPPARLRKAPFDGLF